MKRKRLPSLARLTRKLDRVFSAWIRGRDAPSGMGRCISCGAWAKLQAGHFIKRQHRATRWNEFNVNGQCARCNHFLHGNDGAYCMALIRWYGKAKVEELLALKHKTAKYSRADLEKLIRRYTDKRQAAF